MAVPGQSSICAKDDKRSRIQVPSVVISPNMRILTADVLGAARFPHLHLTAMIILLASTEYCSAGRSMEQPPQERASQNPQRQAIARSAFHRVPEHELGGNGGKALGGERPCSSSIILRPSLGTDNTTPWLIAEGVALHCYLSVTLLPPSTPVPPPPSELMPSLQSHYNWSCTISSHTSAAAALSLVPLLLSYVMSTAAIGLVKISQALSALASVTALV
ncbi:hypothetical protein An01g06490 [Aspergillus niger]|uniref:Uncharacterized protein n=2 Tax=Aspergillus niger TaxID=5061 RepID=A2Q935_ASPNC|nr:hypothetical protein An01g06490 [Aspergillus niger]CAK43769.1 hypothetical protein An01g06490 [Aspergillus niger]